MLWVHNGYKLGNSLRLDNMCQQCFRVKPGNLVSDLPVMESIQRICETLENVDKCREVTATVCTCVKSDFWGVGEKRT